MNDRNQPTRVKSDTKTLIDLVITSKPEIIKGAIKTTELGISDHKLVLATIWSKIKRPPPNIFRARTFKRFDQAAFVKDIESAPWSVCSVFNDPDDCYWAWLRIFKDICQVHAPYREVKIRSVSVPWITPQIQHLTNKRFKMLKMAQRLGDPNLWAEYRELRNRVTREVRLSKSRYYLELFNEVKDCKSYWNWPILLLSLPGKLMESMVASTTTMHVTEQGLGNPNQWAYTQSHSTELLLVKITDDWRQAIDKKHVVGMVFVDFRKAFDAIPHSILLRKLQSWWSWGLMVLDKGYLSGRTQVTTINECQSQSVLVTFGVPQGSVLGPNLFSIFCNDLPNITEGTDGDPHLHMHADDTTVYVSAPTDDLVASKLNEVLARLYTWCCENCLNPHPTKTEYMLLGGRRQLTGPK
ncbi:putative RNA-directed DNA polymerase from transposon BS [Stylophora pistillata]|uniref:Putative RNA-directed DNA polymerase from transposon BS n=1 Tax=Stylophora pistillata TaxID=50429 RepID=A0A2B4RLY3_STYPI|nr:putative RNA-directed DNA polymerase from transposon BS [Stylophora pistillata]